MMKIKIKLLLLLLVLITSCQTIKDGLTGKKNDNSDEFLVKKKNPLELPPDFNELPVPKKDKENTNQSEEIDEEIENLFNNSAEIDLSDDSNDSNQSAEDFVLNEINNN